MEVLRAWFALRFAWILSLTNASSLSHALAIIAISSSFWVAKASHDFNSLSKIFSEFKSTGTCNNWQDDAMIIRSLPSLEIALLTMEIDFSKSLIQIFLPSTTPIDNDWWGLTNGKILSNCSSPLTKSTWIESVSRSNANCEFSANSSK